MENQLWRAVASERCTWEEKKKDRTIRKFCENYKVPRVLRGWTISLDIKVMRYLVRAAEYGTAASIMEKARRREVTKNLVPSETNHLGTFCDGTRGNSFRTAIYFLIFSKSEMRSSKVKMPLKGCSSNLFNYLLEDALDLCITSCSKFYIKTEKNVLKSFAIVLCLKLAYRRC